MTIEELGQRTKSKYSQYSGLSDKEVGEKVLNKYPEYKSQVTLPREKSGLEKFADFILPATARLGRQIGTGLGLRSADQQAAEQSISQANEMTRRLTERLKTEQDPATRELLAKTLRESGANISNIAQETTQQAQQETGITGNRSNLEESLRTGAGFGLEAGALLAPGTSEVQGLRALPGASRTATALQTGLTTQLGQTAGERILGAGLSGLVPGALTGASRAALTAEDIKEGGIDVLEGALIGGATSAAFQSVAELGKWIADGAKRIPKSLEKPAKEVYKSTLKQNIKDQRFYKQAGGEDKVIEDNVRLRNPFTKNGTQRELAKFGPEYGQMVDDVVTQSEKAGDRTDIVKTLNSVRNSTLKDLNRPETRTQYNAAEKYFDDAIEFYTKNDTGTWRFKNDTRKLLDQEVGGQILDKYDQGQKFAMKKFASAIRNEFKTQFPQLKDATRKYQLLAGMSDAFKKEPVFGLPEITSTVAGTALSGGPGGVVGLITGVASRSPGLKRAVAAPIIRSAQQAIIETAPKIAPLQPAVSATTAIQRALDKEKQSRQQRKVLP